MIKPGLVPDPAAPLPRLRAASEAGWPVLCPECGGDKGPPGVGPEGNLCARCGGTGFAPQVPPPRRKPPAQAWLREFVNEDDARKFADEMRRAAAEPPDRDFGFSGILPAAPQPPSERGEPAGEPDLHDLITHRDVWRDAILIALSDAEQCDPDNAVTDAKFWKHELAVFDRTFAAFASKARCEPAGEVERGFAVARQGKLAVDTVSSTARAAMVNGLVTLGGCMVLSTTSDETIKARFDKLGLELVPVTIAALASKAEPPASELEWAQHLGADLRVPPSLDTVAQGHDL